MCNTQRRPKNDDFLLDNGECLPKNDASYVKVHEEDQDFEAMQDVERELLRHGLTMATMQAARLRALGQQPEVISVTRENKIHPL